MKINRWRTTMLSTSAKTVAHEPVLHVIPYLWSGAGNVLTRLCEAQRAHGPVTIVTGGYRGDQPDWRSYRARLRRAGVDHHRIDFYRRDAATFWSSVAELTALVNTLKPAVIHAHAGVSACAAVIARANAASHARVIGQMYSWGPDRPEWMNQQDAAGFSQCDRVVLSARAYESQLINRGVPANKLAYLPWGLPLESFAASAVRTNVDAPRIGFVGRIERRKGQLALVEAFARVVKAYPKARLTLVGPVADTAYANDVRAAIAHHRLGKAVTMTGAVRNVARRVRQWDLFVSLSSDEGQGLAVLEAMALGVPIVARFVAGLSDFIVDGRTGTAIRSTSRTAVAVAMCGALDDYPRTAAIARSARLLVERRYSWHETLCAFDRLYWDRSHASAAA